jgi:hypothetical protein
MSGSFRDPTVFVPTDSTVATQNKKPGKAGFFGGA